MIFRSKRHLLPEQKVRYKRPKLLKRWLMVGMTFLGLCLGIGVSTNQAQAESQPVKAVHSKVISAQQRSKAPLAKSNLLNGKVSKKAKLPNSRFGSQFAPKLGLKNHLNQTHRLDNGCHCHEDGEECICTGPDNNCGCIDDYPQGDCTCQNGHDDDCECGCNTGEEDDDCGEDPDDHDDECGCDDDDDDEDDALLKIKLKNKKTDIYWGQNYTVEGTITYNDNGQLNGKTIKYYYFIDGAVVGDDIGEDVEFVGPQNVGSDPKPFSFTIPHEKMVPGNKYEIFVYAVDENQNFSYPKRLKLIPHAEIETVNKTYYIGDPFDQFGNFAGGLSVTNQPLTKEDISKTVIRDANGKKVLKADWNKITANRGDYTITYTYKYGLEDECGPQRRTVSKAVNNRCGSGGSICKKAEIHVVDRKKITLNYVDENLNPIDSKYLTNLAKGMEPGDHSDGHYGSKFPLVKTPELLFNGEKYYKFVRFEYAVRPAPDLTEDYVTFGDHDQVINVVYKETFAEAPIKVELINIKDSKDSIIENGNSLPTDTAIDPVTKHLVYTINPENITPRPHIGYPITLTNYIKVYSDSSSSSGTMLMLPKGYTIPDGNELKSLGLTQGAPRFGAEVVVRSKFYVAKAKEKKLLVIKHRSVNGRALSLLDTNQAIEDDGSFKIDTNNIKHKPPYGYKIIGANLDESNRVNHSLHYNSLTKMLTGTIPDNLSNPTLTILYRKF